MRYEVKSYLKVEGAFVLVDDYDGGIEDKDYIEGAIALQINGKEVITTEQWDLVDQLWAYLLEAATKIKCGNDYESYFPDQPLLLRFKCIGDYAVELTIGQNSFTVEKTVLIAALSEGGEVFFNRMEQIEPSLKSTWNMYENEASQLSR